MQKQQLSPFEAQQFEKYFGRKFGEINFEEFNSIKKQLLAKYHPDKFAQYEELIQEMAREKYLEIDQLCARAKSLLTGESKSILPAEATQKYGVEGLAIQIMTHDKELKYDLFGRRQIKWLVQGENFKIPTTNARITIETNYLGNSIGFQESIKIWLSFGPEDDIAKIVQWLYDKIALRAERLIIAKEIVPITLEDMSKYIRQKTLLLN